MRPSASVAGAAVRPSAWPAPELRHRPRRALLAALVAALCQAPAAGLLLDARLAGKLLLAEGRGGSDSSAFATCSSLKNRGSHFTVEIGVGTPPQMFDVVADTGSDSVIVADCLCAATHSCFENSRCFSGMNQSSTFLIAGADQGTVAAGPGAAATARVPVVVVSFGSGQVEAMIASDVVHVGKASAVMKNGVLLMIDQALRLRGPFEGILGLGLPRHDKMQMLQSEQALAAPGFLKTPGTHGDVRNKTYEPKGFLQAAGVPRFSMCFNDGADGVLRLGGPKPAHQLGSVGQVHWGLDFRGVSIGNASFSQRAAFCDPTKLGPGQLTACGAIPDSGTTVMMGPTEHLKELFNGICDAWQKCREAAAQVKKPKYLLLQILLERCEEWLPKEGFDGLPTLSFHLAGAGGKEQTLKLPPATYVLEVLEEEVHYVRKYLMGVFPVQVPVSTGKQRKVCAPAFGEQEYNTQRNGPVWILGTPLFYEYQVGYDLDSEPPAVSFSDAPCGACEEEVGAEAQEGKAALLTRGRLSGAAGRRARRRAPLRASGPLLVPQLDTRLPL